MAVNFSRGLVAKLFQRRGLLAAGVAVLLTIWLSNSFGIPIVSAGWLSPTELLNADGTLNLTTGKTGTVDVRGWNVQLDPQRGPVFAPNVPNAPTADSWSALGNGVSLPVRAIAVSGSDVYVGGEFTVICGNGDCNSGNTPMNYVALWDGSTWSALGNGVNGIVHALAVSGSAVYVGGEFTVICGNADCNSGNTTVNYVAKWDGSSWSALGSGVSAAVNAFAVIGNNVYVGGAFTAVCGSADCSSGNTTVNYFARWDGSTWSAPAAGFQLYGHFNGQINALAASGSDVYVGGNFDDIGGVCTPLGCLGAMNHVAMYSYADDALYPLASGVNDDVYALAVNGGDVYVGGHFSEICGDEFCDPLYNSTVNHIAHWNGSTWSALANGVNNDVFVLAASGSNVAMGGDFTQICGNVTCNSGNTGARSPIQWGGSTWSVIGGGAGGYDKALTVSGSDLYIGGGFGSICLNAACSSQAVVNNVAKYGPPPSTLTPTPTATLTPSPTPTRTNTLTRTPTPTYSPSLTPTKTATPTPTRTTTATSTSTSTPTRTLTSTGTPTSSNTPTKTATQTPTRTLTPTNTCAAKPAKPRLITPANDASVKKNTLLLQWNSAHCAQTYNLTVQDVATGKKIENKTGLTVLSDKPSMVVKGKTYSWFVKACNSSGCAKSAVWMFGVP